MRAQEVKKKNHLEERNVAPCENFRFLQNTNKLTSSALCGTGLVVLGHRESDDLDHYFTGATETRLDLALDCDKSRLSGVHHPRLSRPDGNGQAIARGALYGAGGAGARSGYIFHISGRGKCCSM